MVATDVVESVHRYLDAVRDSGIPVAFGVLFGSQVTGKTHEWSDIDLIVVSPRFDGLTDREPLYQLWRIAGRINSRIEPIPCGAKQWEEDDVSPILDVARREGEKVVP